MTQSKKDIFSVQLNEPELKEKSQQPNLTDIMFGGQNQKIKSYGRWGLYSVKVELALYDLRQALYFQSITELVLMLMCIFLLFFHGRFMLFLHALHIIRPLLAYSVLDKLPRSHEFYETLPDDLGQINHDVQVKMLEEFKKSTLPVTRYLIVSLFAIIFDLIALFVETGELGMDKDNIGPIFFMLAVVFVSFDSYLGMWYYTLKFSFPEEVWRNLVTIARGSVDTARVIILGYLQQNRPS